MKFVGFLALTQLFNFESTSVRDQGHFYFFFILDFFLLLCPLQVCLGIKDYQIRGQRLT